MTARIHHRIAVAGESWGDHAEDRRGLESAERGAPEVSRYAPFPLALQEQLIGEHAKLRANAIAERSRLTAVVADLLDKDAWFPLWFEPSGAPFLLRPLHTKGFERVAEFRIQCTFSILLSMTPIKSGCGPRLCRVQDVQLASPNVQHSDRLC